MKRKFSFFTLIMLVLITFSFIGCFASNSHSQTTPREKFWNKHIEKDSCRIKEGVFTAKEFHNGLPEYIKTILKKNNLVPWGRWGFKRSSGLGYLVNNKNIYKPVLVTYVKKRSEVLFKITIIEYEINKEVFRTGCLDINTNITDQSLKRYAEAIFSPYDRILIKLKIRNKRNEWITVYDKETEIKI